MFREIKQKWGKWFLMSFVNGILSFILVGIPLIIIYTLIQSIPILGGICGLAAIIPIVIVAWTAQGFLMEKIVKYFLRG